MKTIKALSINELGVSLVKLTRGIFKIDGGILEIDDCHEKEIQVKDIHNICPVDVSKIITHYEDKDGKKLTLESYEEEYKKLSDKGYSDEYDIWRFNDIDDEYRYKKFCQRWKAIYRHVTTIGDPLPVETQTIKIITNNEFIKPFFNIGAIEDGLYEYDRVNATLKIVKDCFESLGMEWEDNASYADTDHKKIWSNSNHSHLKYVTAFGGYCFGDEWGSVYPLKGTLKQCEEKYNEDKNELETTIKSHYQARFGRTSYDDINIGRIIRHIKDISHYLYKIDSKAKTKSYKIKAIHESKSLIEYFNDT